MFGNPMEIALVVGAAVLLFGGSKIRDVARGLGAAKKEFMVGQAEADLAAERARAEARAQAEANAKLAEPAIVTAPPVEPPPAPSTGPAPSAQP
jgi:TatA/E family protein of Tat protein translocase